MYIYIYIYRDPHLVSIRSVLGAINREFKDVVLEDVVFDHDIVDIDVTIQTIHNRVTKLL